MIYESIHKKPNPKCNCSIGYTGKCLCKNCPSAEWRLNGQNRVKSNCQAKYFVQKKREGAEKKVPDL